MPASPAGQLLSEACTAAAVCSLNETAVSAHHERTPLHRIPMVQMSMMMMVALPWMLMTFVTFITVTEQIHLQHDVCQ